MTGEKKPQRMVKEKKVEKIKEMMHSASSVILSDYRGLSVEKLSDLRRRLRNGIQNSV